MQQVRKKRGFTLVELMVVSAIIVVITIVVIGLAGGFSSEDYPTKAKRTAEANGLLDVTVGGVHHWGSSSYGCGDDDGVAIEVTGRSRAETTVAAVVCCGGVLRHKGCTFRVK
jgi:prepilin-type N-terminal cleavage/methylation domain-containing protein